MEFVLIWLLFGLISSVVANNKGRSVFGWFLIGVLLGPLGLILALVMPNNQESLETNAISSNDSKKCPYCAELIKAEARVCRYYGRDLEVSAAPSQQNKKTSSLSDEQLMKKYGITFDGDKYKYLEYRYRYLRDAIAHAEMAK